MNHLQIHYPVGLGKENKTLKRSLQKGRCFTPGKYPVSTLPGQFQDWFVKYSPEEMKYFPLNTVIYGPVVTDPNKLPPLLHSAEEGSPSESDSESALSEDEASSCSSKEDKKTYLNRKSKECPVESSSSSSSSSDSDVEGPPPAPTLMRELKFKPDATCRICKRKGDDLAHCSDCDKSAHPACLQMTTEMVDVIKVVILFKL